MAKEFAKKFYHSKEWQECKNSYILSVFGQCEKCGGAGEIVHHKTLLNEKNIDDPSVSLNHVLLEYLCINCHNKEHAKKGNILSEGLIFVNGDIVHTPL